MEWIDYAREYMYKGDHERFLEDLGHALHLIQDKCIKVSIIRYREERSHKEEEERLVGIKVSRHMMNEYT